MATILMRGRWLLAACVVSALSLSAMGATKVVVLPFIGLTPDPARDAWIAKAVQQNVIMTLGQARGLEAVASQGAPPTVVDASVAIKAAKAANATFAIFGTYEVIGDQIRFTAHLVDTTGQSFGMVRSAGGVEKLLSLEDQLGEQLRQAAGNPIPALESAVKSRESSAGPPAPPLPGGEDSAEAPLPPPVRQVQPAVGVVPVNGGVGAINFLSVAQSGYGQAVSVGAVSNGFSRSYSSGLDFSWGVHGKNWYMNFNGSAGQSFRGGTAATGVTVGGR